MCLCMPRSSLPVLSWAGSVSAMAYSKLEDSLFSTFSFLPPPSPLSPLPPSPLYACRFSPLAHRTLMVSFRGFIYYILWISIMYNVRKSTIRIWKKIYRKLWQEMNYEFLFILFALFAIFYYFCLFYCTAGNITKNRYSGSELFRLIYSFIMPSHISKHKNYRNLSFWWEFSLVFSLSIFCFIFLFFSFSSPSKNFAETFCQKHFFRFFFLQIDWEKNILKHFCFVEAKAQRGESWVEIDVRSSIEMASIPM